MKLPALLLLLALSLSDLAQALDMRKHIASKTRYAFRSPIPAAPSIYKAEDPEGYEPAYMWFLARHGSRLPTTQRMVTIKTLEYLFQDAKNFEDFPWMEGWTSPFNNISFAGAELHQAGEDEHFEMGSRLRARFPSLTRQPYYPERFPVQSTQVHRAAASAFAFTMGFFPPVPLSRGDGVDASNNTDDRSHELTYRPQAIALTMEPKGSDPLLRFFDVCPRYHETDRDAKHWLGIWKRSKLVGVAANLAERLQLGRSMDPCEVESLWDLCQVEAGILNMTDMACTIFNDVQVALMEWLSDVDLMQRHAYGDPLNYLPAAPLLVDLFAKLKIAAEDKDSIEKASLMFAHCETIVPLASLLGLFNPSQEDFGDTTTNALTSRVNRKLSMGKGASVLHQGFYVTKPSSEQAQTCHHGLSNDTDPQAPPSQWEPPVPFGKNWLFRGSRVAPYAANMAFILYKQQSKDGDDDERLAAAEHLVRLMYNEQVVKIPGCPPADGHKSLDCKLDDFFDLFKNIADLEVFVTACKL